MACRTFIRLLVVLTATLAGDAAAAGDARAQPPADPVGAVLVALQQGLAAGTPDTLDVLLAPSADRTEIDEFASHWFQPGVTRAVVRERDRVPLDGAGHRVVAELLVETGAVARLATLQIDLRLGATAPLVISSLKALGIVEGLHRLTLDTSRQFNATNLRMVAEDLELVVPRGSVFVAEAAGGVTAAVVIGRGEMIFSPRPEGERGQVRLLAGSEVLRTAFDAAHVRIAPADFESLLLGSVLEPAPVDPRALREAVELFREQLSKSFSVDLGDLSSELWSLLPSPGDVLMDVRTRRFGTLTYARAGNEPEDITVFDRARRRNISIYQSRSRLAARGPFFHEDEDADYDVLDYHIETSYAPDRIAFDGRTRIRLRVRAYALSSVTLRLASGLAVRSVASEQGRLLFLRVRNQESLVINLAAPVARGTELTLTVNYGGRLEPQGLEAEMIAGQVQYRDDAPLIEPEPSFVYSSRNYWYPQAPVSDYATATLRFTVPQTFGAVCSGEPAAGSPVTIKNRDGSSGLLHVFVARQPVRYIGCVVSRFVTGESRTVPLPAGQTAGATNGGTHPSELTILTRSTARQRARSGELLESAESIASFYIGLIQDIPYPTFTLAVLESHVPGGHSPAYFAALHQPLPASPFTWRDDPASFPAFPEFFLAHELAHQWWGQGVGWQNYREQWLSEGFAQYFAALYARHRRGPTVFEGILRSMNRWAVSNSDQGAIHLGYRLGHIKNNPKILRALVYNKAAMVLHMARQLVGDEAFFRTLRRFYAVHRFQKAGTDQLRLAFEAETGRSFSRFFDRWIYGAELPSLAFSSRVDGSGDAQVLILRFEQGDTVFDFPVSVTLQLADGTSREIVVPITDKIVEHRVPLPGPLRGVLVNRDRGALIAKD